MAKLASRPQAEWFTECTPDEVRGQGEKPRPVRVLHVAAGIVIRHIVREEDRCRGLGRPNPTRVTPPSRPRPGPRRPVRGPGEPARAPHGPVRAAARIQRTPHRREGRGGHRDGPPRAAPLPAPRTRRADRRRGLPPFPGTGHPARRRGDAPAYPAAQPLQAVHVLWQASGTRTAAGEEGALLELVDLLLPGHAAVIGTVAETCLDEQAALGGQVHGSAPPGLVRGRAEQADGRAGGEEDRRRTLRARGTRVWFVVMPGFLGAARCLAARSVRHGTGRPVRRVTARRVARRRPGRPGRRSRAERCHRSRRTAIGFRRCGVAPLGSAVFSADEMRTLSPPGRVGRTCSYRGGPLGSACWRPRRSDARIIVTSE